MGRRAYIYYVNVIKASGSPIDIHRISVSMVKTKVWHVGSCHVASYKEKAARRHMENENVTVHGATRFSIFDFGLPHANQKSEKRTSCGFSIASMR